MKKSFKKIVALAAITSFFCTLTPAFASPTYTEYDVYVERPSSEAGDKFYHGAKFEPKTGSYLGIFAEGDTVLNDIMAGPEKHRWFVHTTAPVLGRDHANYLLYLHYRGPNNPHTQSFAHYKSYYNESKKLGNKAFQIGLEVFDMANFNDTAYLH